VTAGATRNRADGYGALTVPARCHTAPMIRERLHADLTVAMKARDARRTTLLRTTLAAVANAEAVDPAAHRGQTEVARRHLTEDDVRGVVRREIAELRAAADELRGAGRDEDAVDLEERAVTLATYLDG
jgi:uncharacterized protein